MMTNRRSFLDDLPPAPQEHIHNIPAPSTSESDAPKRPGRKPAHKRKREWEQNHRPVTFVGVPLEVREAICDLAAHYREQYGMVGGVDAVARELVRYSLDEYFSGRLSMLVEPESAPTRLKSQSGWGSDKKSIPRRKPKDKAKQIFTVSYRLPMQQNQAIRSIPEREAEKAAPLVVHLTLGQVVTRLLAHGLDAYKSGRLVLYTAPAMVVPGLKGDYSK
jgi:hypothetical protein